MAIIVENGQKFVVVHGPRGEIVSKTPVGGGNASTYEQQHNPDSHKEFFKQKGQFFEPGTAADDRNTLRRADAMAAKLNRALGEMRAPPASVTLKSITDQDFLDIMAHPEVWKEERFTPISLYHHKIAKLRAPWKGEVGMVEKEDGSLDYYLVLEKGYERMSVAVSAHVPPPVIATSLIAGGAKLVGEPEPPADAPPTEGGGLIDHAFVAVLADGKRVLVIAADEEDARSAFPEGMEPSKMVRSPEFDKCGEHAVVMLQGRMVCSVCGETEKVVVAEDA